jgi:hypothetical protein
MQLMRQIGSWILILALDFFVLRKFHFGPWIAPIVFPFLLFKLPVKMPIGIYLILAFSSGLLADIWMNSGGIHAFALTMAAGMRRPILARVLSPEEWDLNLIPALNRPDIRRFLLSSFFFLFVFQLSFQGILAASFASLWLLLGYAISNTILGMLLLLAWEWAVYKPDRR